MSDTNRISEALDQAAVTAVQGAITTIRSQLPFLIGLTADERRMLPKLGDKSRAFDEKASAYMEQNPDWVPGYVSMEELRKDRALRDALEEILKPIQILCNSVDDTLLQINSEIWMAELAFYSSMKEAARRGADGAKFIADDLGERFPKGRRNGGGGSNSPEPVGNQ